MDLVDLSRFIAVTSNVSQLLRFVELTLETATVPYSSLWVSSQNQCLQCQLSNGHRLLMPWAPTRSFTTPSRCPARLLSFKRVPRRLLWFHVHPNVVPRNHQFTVKQSEAISANAIICNHGAFSMMTAGSCCDTHWLHNQPHNQACASNHHLTAMTSTN